MTSTHTHWNALVLGGGDSGDEFAAAHGVSVKPLIPLNNKPQAWYVLKALQESGRIGHVLYIGPTTPDLDQLIHERLADQGSLLNNLETGITALQNKALQNKQNERVLVVSADIPMLTAQHLQDVLDTAPAEAGLIYPVVRREDCEAAFPGIKRTYATVKEGSFTGGNLFLLDPSLVGRFLPRLRELLAARKAPLKMASLIGWGVLFRLLTRRLTIPKLESKVSELLGVTACALITPHAAIGTDVDKEEDLALAKIALTNHKSTQS